MPLVWQDSFLDALGNDCEDDTINQVDYLFARISLATVQGQSVYQLPAYVRSVARITWRGYKVWPISWRQMTDLSPVSMVIDETEKYEAPQSRPRFYCFHPMDIRSIRFFPTPNETLVQNDTKCFDSEGIRDVCALSVWRGPDYTDPQWSIPEYLSRRTKKAFVLNQAFLKEGKGQNLTASEYYKSKYDFLIKLLKKVNSGHFVSRRPRLNESFNLDGFGRHPHRPILPPNYSRSGE